MLDPHEIVITGDLYFHLDTETAPDVRRFSETLADHGMVQWVTDTTHNKGHILDVVIVRINGAIIYAPPSVYDPCLCDNNGNPSGDHYAIAFTVSARKPAKERKQLQFRRLRQISLPVLKQEITSWMGDFNNDAPASDMATTYNSGLLQSIDHLAPPPLCTKTVTLLLCDLTPNGTPSSFVTKNRADELWLSCSADIVRARPTCNYYYDAAFLSRNFSYKSSNSKAHTSIKMKNNFKSITKE